MVVRVIQTGPISGVGNQWQPPPHLANDKLPKQSHSGSIDNRIYRGINTHTDCQHDGPAVPGQELHIIVRIILKFVIPGHMVTNVVDHHGHVTQPIHNRYHEDRYRGFTL
eukprot:sb/3477316/